CDKLRAGTDAEGDCSVGFGAHSSMTFRELYESTDKDVSSYRSWVRTKPVNKPGSRMSKLKLYV
ncbi:Epithelial-stromal interaction 1%2C partial, partial [Scomber scombrus]